MYSNLYSCQLQVARKRINSSLHLFSFANRRILVLWKWKSAVQQQPAAQIYLASLHPLTPKSNLICPSVTKSDLANHPLFSPITHTHCTHTVQVQKRNEDAETIVKCFSSNSYGFNLHQFRAFSSSLRILLKNY